MPTQEQTPPSRAQITATLVAMYALAEQQLLAGMTTIIRNTPATVFGQLGAVPKMRRLARQIVSRLAYQSNPLVQKMLGAGIDEGAREAVRQVTALIGAGELVPFGGGILPPGGAGRDGGGGNDIVRYSEAPDPFDLSLPHGQRAAEAIRKDIASELEDVRFRITRLPDDIYKAIAPHGAIGEVIDNGFTGQQAQAVAWRVFVENGITGFTDKSGRDWSLSAYVEMAVRTASMRAFNASHLERMHALGIHYFSVPTSLHPCPLCFPWQSKVLTDDWIEDPEIPVNATIYEATAAGLFHPNCEHTLIPVIPGFTVLPDPGEWTEQMALNYKNSQKQRRYEREVRKTRRARDYAVTPDERKKANAKFLDAQRKVREFVNATDGLTRNNRREQANLTDEYAKLPTPIR